MRIGIIGAMQEEVESLISSMENVKKKTKASMDFYEGRLWGNDTVVVMSGIGKVNMAVCAQILIDSFGVEKLINTGVAGGLYKDIEIGDIVISSDAVQEGVSNTFSLPKCCSSHCWQRRVKPPSPHSLPLFIADCM